MAGDKYVRARRGDLRVDERAKRNTVRGEGNHVVKCVDSTSSNYGAGDSRILPRNGIAHIQIFIQVYKQREAEIRVGTPDRDRILVCRPVVSDKHQITCIYSRHCGSPDKRPVSLGRVWQICRRQQIAPYIFSRRISDRGQGHHDL